LRPAREGLFALGILALLAAAVTLLTPRASVVPAFEPRSTFLAGPTGARGLADALTRLGVPVVRMRHPLRRLGERIPAPGDTASARLVAVLDPMQPLDAFDARELAAWVGRGGQVLIAGQGGAEAMRCFGFTTVFRGDSIAAAPPGVRPGPRAAYVSVVLAPTGERVAVDSVEAAAGVVVRCGAPRLLARDTLLLTSGNRLVAVRLRFAGGGAATLVSDGRLFANRSLRETDAGVEMLALLADRSRAVYVDEYHQGFRQGGSLGAEVLAWSRRSPWGWVAWQLAAVGLLALLASAIRFGPAVPVIERKRRSPLEHVRALATALAAARGHDVAVRLMVRGLRRRLSQDVRPERQPIDDWLAALGDRVRTPRARAAARTLTQLIIPPQPADAVLRAAHAVEEVWQEQRP
jgi:hypothetical protein